MQNTQHNTSRGREGSRDWRTRPAATRTHPQPPFPQRCSILRTARTKVSRHGYYTKHALRWGREGSTHPVPQLDPPTLNPRPRKRPENAPPDSFKPGYPQTGVQTPLRPPTPTISHPTTTFPRFRGPAHLGPPHPTRGKGAPHFATSAFFSTTHHRHANFAALVGATTHSNVLNPAHGL